MRLQAECDYRRGGRAWASPSGLAWLSCKYCRGQGDPWHRHAHGIQGIAGGLAGTGLSWCCLRVRSSRWDFCWGLVNYIDFKREQAQQMNLMFEPKVTHLRRCRKICNPHNHEVAPVENSSAPCIWATLNPNMEVLIFMHNSDKNLQILRRI